MGKDYKKKVPSKKEFERVLGLMRKRYGELESVTEGVRAVKAYDNIHKARNEFLERWGKLKKQLNTLKTESPNNEFLRLEKQLYKFESDFISNSSKIMGEIQKIVKSNLTETINEKISKEEWAEYPKYARKLKPYMQRLLKVPLRVKVIKQANANPWIDIRVARFGKDIIPNDFRKKALKVIGGGKARDMDNINYGNIRSNSVSLKHNQWIKLLGSKV
jgi:sugar-specific transcriptional regulator TrmB